MAQPVVDHLTPLVEAVDRVDAQWITALGGLCSSAVIDDDVDAMSDAGLLALNDALAAVVRSAHALHARIANGISKRSAPELGSDGLARKAGYRSPVKLIAAVTGGHPGDAQRLIQVGDATAGRITFSGERAPARHPHVATAVAAGSISVDAASAITTLLDKVACRADRALLDRAEQTLVEQSAGLSLQDVHVLLRRAEAYLDPDGVAPKIADLRAKRYLKIGEDQHGMITLDARLDPATGAPIKAAVEALVTAQIRATRGRNHPDGTGGASGWEWGGIADDGAETGASSPLAETRSIPQLNADALAAIARHALGCDQVASPLAATTVVVRVPLDALTTGTGIATIDGITQPIDAGTARRLAADAEVIPLVLGGESEVLDLGRRRRLFTKAQRLSLWERDGGCAGCGGPPEMCEAHHLTWWSRGGGTDLSNGILLCTGCHHRIHAEDWEIRVVGSAVWFVSPPHIDPARTPRRGGRRRHDYRPAA